MAKTISLPEIIYADLTSISEELESIAGKPFSPAMTTSLLIAVYRAHLSEPCARDAFWQKIANSDFMAPEEFDKEWDVPASRVKMKLKKK